MTPGDAIERLRRANPAPLPMPPPPIEPLLERLGVCPSTRPVAWPRPPESASVFVVLALAIALAVAGSALVLLGQRHARTSDSSATAPAAMIPPDARDLAATLATSPRRSRPRRDARGSPSTASRQGPVAEANRAIHERPARPRRLHRAKPHAARVDRPGLQGVAELESVAPASSSTWRTSAGASRAAPRIDEIAAQCAATGALAPAQATGVVTHRQDGQRAAHDPRCTSSHATAILAFLRQGGRLQCWLVTESGCDRQSYRVRWTSR